MYLTRAALLTMDVLSIPFVSLPLVSTFCFFGNLQVYTALSIVLSDMLLSRFVCMLMIVV